MDLIVAVDENWAIGHQNGLLVRISADLKRFKALTMGHPVLLGRKTLQTFPGGRPLPGRRNLILSTNLEFHVDGAETLHSIEEAVKICPKDTFVIGGGQIYNSMLPYCSTAYVTKLHGGYPADTWFPDLDADPEWTLAEEEAPLSESGAAFHYCIYRRKR